MQIGIVARIHALRQGLAAMLESTHHGNVIEVDEPCSWAATCDNPVVVLALDDVSETSTIVDLRTAAPNVAVIALLPSIDAGRELSAVRAGAAAVETWDVDAATLGHIVDLVACDHTVLKSSMAQRLALGEESTLSRISASEIGWLAALARGETVTAVAHDAGFSEREMYRRLSDVYARLGARDKTHALLIATKLGLIAV